MLETLSTTLKPFLGNTEIWALCNVIPSSCDREQYLCLTSNLAWISESDFLPDYCLHWIKWAATMPDGFFLALFCLKMVLPCGRWQLREPSDSLASLVCLLTQPGCLCGATESGPSHRSSWPCPKWWISKQTLQFAWETSQPSELLKPWQFIGFPHKPKWFSLQEMNLVMVIFRGRVLG